MLAHLSIRDFTIIDALDLPLEPGLNALTGETGAGKSILIDALSLLLGGRARTELIRADAERAEVAAQLVLPAPWQKRLEKMLDEAGLPRCDDGALILRRVVHRTGRHKQFINGGLATVGQLKEIVGSFVAITGQSAEQALRDPVNQRELVDDFGRHGTLRDEIRTLVRQLRALVDEREELARTADEKTAQLDYLRYQIEEIENLDPQLGEEGSLVDERNRLKNTEGLRTTVAEALASLSEGDSDALSRVQQASMTLGRAEDATLSSQSALLEEAAALIDDVARTLDRYGDNLTNDPARLEEVDDRLHALRQLMRKHGNDVDAVLHRRDEMQAEVDGIDGADERVRALDDEIAQGQIALRGLCDRLTSKRRQAARRLAKEIQAELQDLGMPKASIEIVISASAPQKGALLIGEGKARRAAYEHGADKIEILLRANPGETAGPLGKAASGGELSRVHLAVKRALLERDPAPISIFDEVDAGVGGAVGDAIGAKLREIAQDRARQVFCVTHLAQIAARAHVHLQVSKTVEDGRTRSHVAPLEGKAREEEIARMIGGAKITKKTRAHAAELLTLGSAA